MLATVILALLIQQISSIPINNGVIGDPEIECDSDAIAVSFNVQNSFEGNVYVKGMFDQEECRISGDGDNGARIKLYFDSCNIQQSRSLNPRGIFVSTSVVISFHPQFVTKVDRAYRIQCFYMEAVKTVNTNVDVSDMTTLFHSLTVPMPVCRYEILDGGPTGQPVQFAAIGQQVYHKWTCDSETINTFCAVVHSCYVNDGNGNRIEILDTNGCAIDKYLLNNLEYPTDLMAGQETHVYKYADRAQLYYQCQISITVKEPNGFCPRPECPEPKGFGSINTVQIGKDIKGGTQESASEEFSDEDDEEDSQEETEKDSQGDLQGESHRDSGKVSERVSEETLEGSRQKPQRGPQRVVGRVPAETSRIDSERNTQRGPQSVSGRVSEGRSGQDSGRNPHRGSQRGTERVSEEKSEEDFERKPPRGPQKLSGRVPGGSSRKEDSGPAPQQNTERISEKVSETLFNPVVESDEDEEQSSETTYAPFSQTPDISILSVDMDTFNSGYKRWRRSATENIIDVSANMEALDMFQDEVTPFRGANGQYIDVKNAVCVSVSHVLMLVIAALGLIIFSAITAYILRH